MKGTITAAERTNTGPYRVVLKLEFSPIACTGSDALLQPFLVAIQVDDPSESQSALIRMATAGAESSTIASLFQPSRPNMPSSDDKMLTSKNQAPTVTGYSKTEDNAELTTGTVRGLRGVTLELPSKDAGTRVQAKRGFHLNQDAILVLAMVPLPGKRPAARDTLTAESPSVKHPPHSTTSNEIANDPLSEVCADSGCQQILAAPEPVGKAALWALQLAKLGYQPRPDVLITALENSSTVHFLGPDQILLTFPLHTLVKRSAQQALWAAKPRRIRAVLIARTDGHVLKIQDWTVPTETGPYLWTYQQNEILAQIGEELVVLGPDLNALRRFTLPGPLCFLSTAPGGELVLLATVHERHKAQEHQEISRYLGPGQSVDEDYDLTGLNAQLERIGSQLLQTMPLQPGILKTALLSARQLQADHWELEQTPWEGKKTVLAHLRSTCSVSVSVLPSDRILVRGCTPNQTSSTWYRVLNDQGKFC